MNIPTTDTIERMSAEDRSDLEGWLRVELRAANQRAADAKRTEARLCAEQWQYAAEVRANEEHARACLTALTHPAFDMPSNSKAGG